MNSPIQKISLRGTLADDIATQLLLSEQRADLSNIVGDILEANPDDFICIPEGGLLKIGRKSEVGQFPPDW
jgi:23S rRNA maturation-related 3'-5' exoribonuclease YhaM